MRVWGHAREATLGSGNFRVVAAGVSPAATVQTIARAAIRESEKKSHARGFRARLNSPPRACARRDYGMNGARGK